MQLETKEREAKKEFAMNSAFDKWLAEPMTRMGLSMIPKADKDDAVKLLLRSAFDAGAAAGSGNTAGEFIGAMLDGLMKSKKEPGRE